MAPIVPPARPEITRSEVLALAKPYLTEDDKVFIFGRRGYYRDSMGRKNENDYGIYDDAICLVTPNQCTPYNANTDPSKEHKGVALLQPGRWLYKLGIHGLSKPKDEQYEALVQAHNVWVHRAGTADVSMEETDHYHPQYGYRKEAGSELWRGMFGINIHRGSRFSTSSLGCQTIHPSQWGDFMEKVKSMMTFYGVKIVPYILTDRGNA